MRPDGRFNIFFPPSIWEVHERFLSVSVPRGDFDQNLASGSGIGVFGVADVGIGVEGDSQDGTGVYGQSAHLYGVVGYSRSGTGVKGFGGTAGDGVFGTTQAADMSGVAGIHTGNGHGVYGRADGNGFAGWFQGNVTVTGDIVLRNGDCAEEFDIASTENTEPGMVVALDQQGTLQPSSKAYDKTVAGVISGAGDYKPGLILDKKEPSKNRMPVALVGKVYCKVDAQYAPIEVGDLLTTSPTLGHAMKAEDHLRAFGAVIGKALRPLSEGQGMIPILIALQ